MSIESVIAQTLKTWPELADVVVRPDKVEQTDQPPYIVYQKVAGHRVQSLQGDSGLANPHFQFDVYARTRAQAIELREGLRHAIAANPALGAVHAGEGAGFEEDTKLCRERIDFSFWFADQQ